jgi:hypothetical protein
MNRDKIMYLVVGALLYFAFLRYRGVVSGMPWAPMHAATA